VTSGLPSGSPVLTQQEINVLRKITQTPARFWDWMFEQAINDTGLDLLVIAVAVLASCFLPAILIAI
jgi:hypothetical protein